MISVLFKCQRIVAFLTQPFRSRIEGDKTTFLPGQNRCLLSGAGGYREPKPSFPPWFWNMRRIYPHCRKEKTPNSLKSVMIPPLCVFDRILTLLCLFTALQLDLSLPIHLRLCFFLHSGLFVPPFPNPDSLC